MNNAKHFIKRQDKMPLFTTEKDEQHDRLHRAASVVLDALKRGEQPTAAMIYDLEGAL